MSGRKSVPERTAAQVAAQVETDRIAAFDAQVEPAPVTAALSKAAQAGTARAAQHAHTQPPVNAPVHAAPTNARRHTRSSTQRSRGFFVWFPRNAFTASLYLSAFYILKCIYSGDPIDPSVPIILVTTGLILWIVWTLMRYIWAILRAEAVVEADAALVLPSVYSPYIPVSTVAVSVFRLLSTGFALYLALLVLLNIEILMLFPLVLKQRGYSYLYKELGTPVVGPVFMTQAREGVFWMMDGLLAPWSMVMGLFGGGVGWGLGDALKLSATRLFG